MSVLMNYGVNTNISGVNGFGRQVANANGTLVGIYGARVAATTDTTLTVPSPIGNGQLAGDKPSVLAIISYKDASTVFVAVDTVNNAVTTAAPTTSGTFAAQASCIKPAALLVKGGDVLHFYPLAEADVAVEFYTVT